MSATLNINKYPKLKELKSNRVAPLQSFSKMGNTRIKTMRTVKAIARHQGKRLIVADVESFNHHSGCKKDMFGIFDAIAIECDYNPGEIFGNLSSYFEGFKNTKIRALQACATDWNPHINKLKENSETCALWLSAGNTTLELWGWRKVKRNGRSVYRPKVQLITVGFLLGNEDGKVIEVFQD